MVKRKQPAYMGKTIAPLSDERTPGVCSWCGKQHDAPWYIRTGGSSRQMLKALIAENLAAQLVIAAGKMPKFFLGLFWEVVR
jgi:hypothetical protein